MEDEKKIAVIGSYESIFRDWVKSRQKEGVKYIFIQYEHNAHGCKFDGIEYCPPFHPNKDIEKLTEICRKRLKP